MLRSTMTHFYTVKFSSENIHSVLKKCFSEILIRNFLFFSTKNFIKKFLGWKFCHQHPKLSLKFFKGYLPEKLNRKLWSIRWSRKCPNSHGHVREIEKHEAIWIFKADNESNVDLLSWFIWSISIFKYFLDDNDWHILFKSVRNSGTDRFAQK